MMRTIVVLTLLMLTISVEVHARMSPEARHSLQGAQQYIDAGDYPKAAQVMQEYVRTAEGDIPEDAYLMLGAALYRAGNLQEAVKWYVEGAAKVPDGEMLAFNAAVACHELGRYREAGGYYERAFSLGKKPDLNRLYTAGIAYYAAEDFTNAARVMRLLLARAESPKPEWLQMTIHALVAAKQPAAAEEMVLRYLALKPEEASYWELLAKLYLEREHYTNAGAALEVAYRLRAPSQQELENLASIYTYVNAPLMALAALQRAYSEPSSEQLVRIARLAASAGRTDLAVRTLSSNAGPVLEEEKGALLFDARRFQEAAEAFNTTLQENPEAYRSSYFLALCFWEQKDWRRAEEIFKRLAATAGYKEKAAGPLAVLDDIETARKGILQ